MIPAEIRAIECGTDVAQSCEFLREIAAQLAEANDLKRQELALRKTGDTELLGALKRIRDREPNCVCGLCSYCIANLAIEDYRQAGVR
jgi:hypothetical protein